MQLQRYYSRLTCHLDQPSRNYCHIPSQKTIGLDVTFYYRTDLAPKDDGFIFGGFAGRNFPLGTFHVGLILDFPRSATFDDTMREKYGHFIWILQIEYMIGIDSIFMVVTSLGRSIAELIVELETVSSIRQRRSEVHF